LALTSYIEEKQYMARAREQAIKETKELAVKKKREQAAKAAAGAKPPRK
jgi:hypothetical protein